MQKTSVTSNFQKFNKRQVALIDRFGIGVSSSMVDVLSQSMELASERGIEYINAPDLAKKEPPYKIKGQAIYNPIPGKKNYQTIRDQKDTKKVLNRTGTLASAFKFFFDLRLIGRESMNKRGLNQYLIVDRKNDVARLRAGFLGNPARALNNVSTKDAATRLRGRRRFVETSFNTMKNIFKKMMLNKRLLA